MSLIERLHRGGRNGDTAGHDHTIGPGAMPSFVERHYDLLWRLLSMGRTRNAHAATLELAGFRPDDDLLDIGCGTGTLVIVAKERFGATGLLVGLDVSPGMIGQAQAKAKKLGSGATFGEGSMTSVPYPDESFDLVTSSLMLHHVPAEEHPAGFKELHRVLRPGGRIVVADINLAERSILSRVHGVRSPKEDRVRHEVPGQLEAAGFRVLRSGQHRFRALSSVVAAKAP